VKTTLPGRQTRMETTIRYEGEQYSEAQNREAEKLDDFVTMDLKLIQPFKIRSTAAEAYVQVDNLWDTGFEVHHGYPDDGVRVAGGINVTF